MKLVWISSIIGIVLGAFVGAYYFSTRSSIEAEIKTEQFSNSEAGFEDIMDESISSESQATTSPVSSIIQSLSRSGRWAYYWKEFTLEEKSFYQSKKRTPGPARVGVQVGHWKNSEVPDELSGLKRNGSGATGGGKTEVEIVLQIAQKVKTLLEAKGVVVDLLPATIPVDYSADAFVSIHADGNTNPAVSGFKIASPQRDFSGKSVSLMENLYETYAKETSLQSDSNITRRMSAYYAFNWRRYEHALSPLTPAVIVETGFLTSPTDRKIIVSNQDKSARGIANGILNFLSENSLI